MVDGAGTLVGWEVDEGVLEKVADSLAGYLERLVREIGEGAVKWAGAELGYRQ